ncbi:MAG: hypothetical protein EBR18_08075 [Betaproteobacteria bacterium]|nr:hypothetical protein [Betaproteobacteria bacterium]
MLILLRRHASLVVIFLIAVTAGLATWHLRGTGAFMTALWHAWDLFLFIVPSLVAGLLLASALRQLLSPDALARWMGVRELDLPTVLPNLRNFESVSGRSRLPLFVPPPSIA